MKPHKFMWLFCFVILYTVACKKQTELVSNVAPSVVTADAESSSLNSFSSANFLFVHGIDNPYLAFTKGTVFYYVNLINDGKKVSHEDIHVSVTSDIKKILGVSCTVVHDQVKENGEITEDTYDWYAQDKFGNVWYFGEDTKALTDTG